VRTIQAAGDDVVINTASENGLVVAKNHFDPAINPSGARPNSTKVVIFLSGIFLSVPFRSRGEEKRHRQKNAGQEYQEHEIETPRTAEPTQASLEHKWNRSSPRLCRGAIKEVRPCPPTKKPQPTASIKSLSKMCLSKMCPASRPLSRTRLTAVALADMVLADVTRRAIDRVVTEYHQREKLRSHGLSAAARTRVREVSRCRDGHPQRQKGQPLDVHLLRQALKIPKATAESSLSLATLPHADWLRVLATTRLDI